MYWPKSHGPDWGRKVGRLPQDAPRDIRRHRSVWAHRCTSVLPSNTAGTMLGAIFSAYPNPPSKPRHSIAHSDFPKTTAACYAVTGL